MGFFATLNPEQLGLVQRARQASEPFAIGACFDQALAALRRDFWNIVLVHLVFMVVAWVVVFTPPLVLGLARFNAKSLRGEPAGFSDLFSGLDDFLDAWLLFLVAIPLLIVGYALCLLPGIYLATSWSLAFGLLAEKRGTFWECLELSRQVVTPHWGWAFLLPIVAGFVSGLGVVACGVGVLATLPLGSLMLEAAHQRVCVPATA